MSRIACLRIPRFQIAAHDKQEPELKNLIWVLLSEGTKSNISQQEILLCSKKALKKQIVPGMKLKEAQSMYADIIWRETKPSLYMEAQSQLINALVSCSPRISAQELGMFILDASGLKHMGGESRFCMNVLKAASKLGFTEGQIGLADSAFTARVASKVNSRRWQIIPEGKDQEFLSKHSIEYLQINLDTLESFSALGIYSMGQLADMPMESIRLRFGEEGVRAWELSKGIDDDYPKLPQLKKSYQCYINLGYPATTISEAAFTFKSILNRLTEELKKQNYCAEELIVTFYNEDDEVNKRELDLMRPSNNAKFLLDVLKLSLESHPLDREFTAVELNVSKFTEEPWEQIAAIEDDSSETNNENKISDSMLLLLQKLRTKFDTDLVYRPVSNDQYVKEEAGMWLSVLESSSKHSILEGDKDFARPYSRMDQLDNGFVLRKYSSAVKVLMEIKDGHPTAIHHHRQWHSVKRFTKLDCLSGMWWDDPVQKSYYTVLLENEQEPESLVLLVNDHLKNGWFLEGYFD